MDVVLTWSRAASHAVASFLHGWLPNVIPGVEPWISDEDIGKGKKWFHELMEQLGMTSVSITCVTPENVRSPWLYYEVGAIAAKQEEGVVCPYLIGVEAKSVGGTPLSEFQCTRAQKEDTWKLVRSINKELGDRGHNQNLLRVNFDAQWPKLEEKLNEAAGNLVGLEEAESYVEEVEPVSGYALSEEARELLLNACEDPRGTITYVRFMGGAELATNGKNFIAPYNARNEALWKGALDELIAERLVEPRGHKGEVFAVTRYGYEYADTLTKGPSEA